jgi:hypothetical protein
MGYYVEKRDSKFFIASKDFAKAVKAIRKTGTQKDKMSGGAYQGGKTLSKHYAWVDMSYVDDTDLKTIFGKWRWEVSFDLNGNIDSIYFEGSKLGDDEFLFEAIAPWVKSGSFIEMSGEDGVFWKWCFEDGKFTTKYGEVVYGN